MLVNDVGATRVGFVFPYDQLESSPDFMISVILFDRVRFAFGRTLNVHLVTLRLQVVQQSKFFFRG